MRIYAERPGRALMQLVADVAVIAWVVFVVQSAQVARDLILQLQTPARRLTGAGDAIRGAFDNAATTASGVPFVGDDLARALGSGGSAGDSLASSGREIAATTASVAMAVAAAVVLLGVVPVVAVGLTLGGRWMAGGPPPLPRAPPAGPPLSSPPARHCPAAPPGSCSG